MMVREGEVLLGMNAPAAMVVSQVAVEVDVFLQSYVLPVVMVPLRYSLP